MKIAQCESSFAQPLKKEDMAASETLVASFDIVGTVNPVKGEIRNIPVCNSLWNTVFTLRKLCKLLRSENRGVFAENEKKR